MAMCLVYGSASAQGNVDAVCQGLVSRTSVQALTISEDKKNDQQALASFFKDEAESSLKKGGFSLDNSEMSQAIQGIAIVAAAKGYASRQAFPRSPGFSGLLSDEAATVCKQDIKAVIELNQ